MPITKNKIYGKHQNVTEVAFGTGDISIVDGYHPKEPNIKMLGLG